MVKAFLPRILVNLIHLGLTFLSPYPPSNTYKCESYNFANLNDLIDFNISSLDEMGQEEWLLSYKGIRNNLDKLFSNAA